MGMLRMHIEDIFGDLEDPRVERTQKHPFLSIIFIGMCGAMAGIETWIGLEDYTESHREFFDEQIGLPGGVPSHDTFSRVIGSLDVEEFNRCFMEFTALLQSKFSGVIAIDGKTMRGSFDKKSDKAALHCVSAWSDANSLVLGQVMVDDKSNEITAIPKLLALLNIEGQTVTIDAMGCQTAIAAQIVEKGGDYILALKGNQGTLHDDIKLLFKDHVKNKFKDFKGDFIEETDGGHGRIEVRKCWVTDDIDWLKDSHQKWKKLTSVVMIEAKRDTDDKPEQRFYISSHKADASLIGKSVRAHWGVENKLHWVLDVTMGEDYSRIRTNNGPEIMTIFRRWALNILRQHNNQISLKRKQEKIKMSPKYLCQYLSLSI